MRTNRPTLRSLCVLLAMLAVGAPGLAQPTPKSSAAPPATSASASPSPDASAPPPTEPGSELPPGHPPIADAAPGSMATLADRFSQAVPNTATSDGSLAPDEVLVEVRDDARRPVPGDSVRISSWEGTDQQREKRFEQRVQAGPQGTVSIRVPAGADRWFHQVVVEHEGVPYASPLFNLEGRAGKRVRVHVYGVVDDVDAALVGVQAFMFVEPVDQGLAVQQMLRFSNLGNRAWRCGSLALTLPHGFQALEGSTEGPLGWQKMPDRGVRLIGFVPPGTTELTLRYQVPYPGVESRRLHVGLPPRVGHLRVMAAIPATMSLRVDNLPAPVARRGDDGGRMMITEGAVPPGADQIELATIVMGGLPVRGNARWYALLLAAAAVVVGGVVAVQGRFVRAQNVGGSAGQAAARREALLKQLVEVEVNHGAGKLDKDAYKTLRERLLNDLASVLVQEEAARTQPMVDVAEPGPKGQAV